MEIIILVIIILLSGGFERFGKYMKNMTDEKNEPGSVGNQDYRSIFEKYLAKVEEENHPWKQRRRTVNLDPGKIAAKRAQRTSSFSTDLRSSATEAESLEGFEAEGYSLEGSEDPNETNREYEEKNNVAVDDSNYTLSAEPGKLSLPSAGFISGEVDLKAAIIWSEILQKPKALRRRQ